MAMILFCIINYYYHAITYTKTTESRLCHSSKKSFVSKELSLFPAETATRCSRFSIVWKFMNLSPIQSMSLLTTMHYSIILLCNNSESPFLLRFITGKYIRYPLRTCFFFLNEALWLITFSPFYLISCPCTLSVLYVNKLFGVKICVFMCWFVQNNLSIRGSAREHLNNQSHLILCSLHFCNSG